MSGPNDDPFTGLLTQLVRSKPRAHDPAVAITAGEMPPWFPGESTMGCSGAGRTADQADQACFGEALERCLRARPAVRSIDPPSMDRLVAPRAGGRSGSLGPLPQRAIRHLGIPVRTFHARDGLPLGVLPRDTNGRTALGARRDGFSDAPTRAPGATHFRFVDGTVVRSHGRSGRLARCARGHRARCAVGGWWSRYPLEEWPATAVLPAVGESTWNRLDRPGLHYRFYRIRTPYSSHVTLISLAGLDHEGWVFCVGSACRETLRESWLKSLLEAVQGRHCVRRLLARWVESDRPRSDLPTTFFEHALFYTLNPGLLPETVLEHAGRPEPGSGESEREGLTQLRERLGPDRPILFRNLTPPGLADGFPGWVVFRVLVPGLQALHGDHRLPFLGGPLWAPRLGGLGVDSSPSVRLKPPQ